MLPAVCLGSNTGSKLTRVAVRMPPMRAFDPARSHHRMRFDDAGSTAYNDGKWATAVAAHAGIVHGTIAFSVKLTDVESGGGVAIGVVDALKFDHRHDNLGASKHSWAFSKTGKIGRGRGFETYSTPFGDGDVITCVCDASAGTLRFFVNGVDQGYSFSADGTASGSDPELKGRVLVPAVCLGSSSGHTMCRVRVLPNVLMPVMHFDQYSIRKGPSGEPLVAFNHDYGRAETMGEWTSALAMHPGVREGYLTFAVRVDSAESQCGAAIGIADAVRFEPKRANLGATAFSWAYSKTGKSGDGTGSFKPYGPKFGSGDIITVDCDVTRGTLQFFLNGECLGLAPVTESIRGRRIVPGVCIGSNHAGRYSAVSLCPPSVVRWDARLCNRHIQLDGNHGASRAYTDYKWCTVLADHPGVRDGQRMAFAV